MSENPMENYDFGSSSFPSSKDDYALALLTKAAKVMHTRPNDPDTAGDQPARRNVTTEAWETTRSSNQNLQHNTSIDPRSPHRSPDVLAGYNPDILSSRSMGPLSFDPSLGQRQHPASMSSGYQGIGSHMSQNYANTLGILNAESYDDGRSAMREEDVRGMRSRAKNEIPFGMEIPGQRGGFENHVVGSEEDGNRKGRRKKRKDDSADEEEEARKKARGRPRVDTKDETAADRRRTQIRMAQRAYRHRKETTISSLEKQVQDLKGTNEEMNNIFINLYDFAIARGLLQREPEFGQQLQSTTERFLALAKSTQDENYHDENNEEEAKHHEEPESGRTAKGRRASPKKRQEATPPVSEPAPSWGGYAVSKDDSPVEEIDFGVQQNQGYRRSDDLQIVTRPTIDNASFPFDLMDLQTYRVEVPQIEDFSQNFFPQSQLPLPSSYNYNEFSFARRMHRGAIERAFRLISSTSTNPKIVIRHQEVFGLCLLYDSREGIRATLKRLMGGSTKDTLQDWRAPYVHVGGSGTYYPMHDSDLNGDLMPKFRTGYSMGPFSPSVARVQEVMEDDMRCTLPGFEGDFFDPNDVEGYLRGHGLDIAPAAEFVTGDLDLAGLEVSSPKTSRSESIASPRTPRSLSGNFLRGTGRDAIIANLDFPRSEITKAPQNCLTFPLGFASWDNDGSIKENNDFIDPNFTAMQTEMPSRATPETAMTGRQKGEKQTITINVKTLLEELLDRVVCLGRAPGIRPSDVNAAILAAVRVGLKI